MCRGRPVIFGVVPFRAVSCIPHRGPLSAHGGRPGRKTDGGSRSASWARCISLRRRRAFPMTPDLSILACCAAARLGNFDRVTYMGNHESSPAIYLVPPRSPGYEVPRGSPYASLSALLLVPAEADAFLPRKSGPRSARTPPEDWRPPPRARLTGCLQSVYLTPMLPEAWRSLQLAVVYWRSWSTALGSPRINAFGPCRRRRGRGQCPLRRRQRTGRS